MDSRASEIRKVPAGRIPYATASDWQRSLHARRLQGEIPDVLLLLEHPHVYTLGRRFSPEHLLLSPDLLRHRGIEVCETDRGGSVTYHGPGQLVAYPVVDLRTAGRSHPDVILYLRRLEQAIIETVAALGVRADTRHGLTGVWVGDEKLAAIGVHISRGVAKHGLALNVSTDLDYFRWMVPCGIADCKVTSLERLGIEMPMEEVAELLASKLARILGRTLVASTLSSLGLDGPGEEGAVATAPSHRPAGRVIHV